MKETTAHDWTHKAIKISDIRRLKDLYVISVNNKGLKGIEVDTPLFVNRDIFEKRLESYFLQPASKITRDQVLSVDWNMYITKGYYIKFNSEGRINEYSENTDPDKYYVSFLEINGDLAEFKSVYK